MLLRQDSFKKYNLFKLQLGILKLKYIYNNVLSIQLKTKKN